MSYRILIEIGHEASIRTKRTPEGFTHDWEIFVRGCDADIQHYVEKVVFNLHETFTKPRRVVKEPPYKVKESGYAGFNLLIELYLKNSEEPKKITFYYDLNLQQSGPAISKVQKEKYVFHHPNEEFRQRLIKGGAMLVNAPSTLNDSLRDVNVSSDDRSQLVDKPKLVVDQTKKHKIRPEEPKFTDSFADLFGPPITKTAKVSPDPKSQIKNSPKNVATKIDKNNMQEKLKSKHSPHKEKSERSKDKDHTKKNKEEKKSKDKVKERDKSKEKSSKRDKSPPRPSTSPRRSPKRELSPKKNSSPKRVITPPPPLPPPPPPPKPKVDEPRKYEEIKEKNSDKKLKKDKKDKIKDKDKDKYKEYKSHNKEEIKNETDLKDIKNTYKESAKPIKDKEIVKNKEKKIEPDKTKEFDGKQNDKQKNEKSHETNEKHKHKHKKKDRDKAKKDEKEKRHDKKTDKNNGDVIVKTSNDSMKILQPPEPDKDEHQTKNNITVPNNTDVYVREEIVKVPKEKPTNPLKTLIAEAEEINDSSDSSTASIVEQERPKNNVKPPLTVERDTKFVEPKEMPPPPAIVPPEPEKKPEIERTEKTEKIKKPKKHKDKHKSSRSPDKDNERKRKRKSSKNDDVGTEKRNDERPQKQIKDERSEEDDEPKITTEITRESPQTTSADYMLILKDLQHKIMTLQDNSELQRVVQLIAETGQYEITRQTFDFDLCALDRGTVRRLQEFFTAT